MVSRILQVSGIAPLFFGCVEEVPHEEVPEEAPRRIEELGHALKSTTHKTVLLDSHLSRSWGKAQPEKLIITQHERLILTAGILRPADLAGYRNAQVFIQRSMHVPPSQQAVRDLMPAFFDLIREEEDPAVRVVLGHFAFVHIHPYMDGNVRLGRFLMNLMCAGGGYPWTVIPVQTRAVCMAALEEASVRQNIAPFADILAALVTSGVKGKNGEQ